MLRASRTAAASPRDVLRAIVAEAEAVREPDAGHPNWRQRYSRVQVSCTGDVFRIRFATRWTSGETGTPELRGSVSALPDGGSIVHATCGYGWYHGAVALGLTGGVLLAWLTGEGWALWWAGIAGASVVAGKVEDARRSEKPDRYMLYLMQRLDIALESAAPGGSPSTETNTGEGADGCVGSRSI